MPEPTRQLEARVLLAISQATTEVLANFCGIAAVAGTPTPLPPATPCVVGIVTLEGIPGGEGCLSCTPEAAQQIASRVFLIECESLNAEVLDAIGEAANMVVGNIKTILAGSLQTMDLSPPKVSVSTVPTGIAVPFTTALGEVRVQFSINS